MAEMPDAPGTRQGNSRRSLLPPQCLPVQTPEDRRRLVEPLAPSCPFIIERNIGDPLTSFLIASELVLTLLLPLARVAWAFCVRKTEF